MHYPKHPQTFIYVQNLYDNARMTSPHWDAIMNMSFSMSERASAVVALAVVSVTMWVYRWIPTHEFGCVYVAAVSTCAS